MNTLSRKQFYDQLSQGKSVVFEMEELTPEELYEGVLMGEEYDLDLPLIKTTIKYNPFFVFFINDITKKYTIVDLIPFIKKEFPDIWQSINYFEKTLKIVDSLKSYKRDEFLDNIVFMISQTIWKRFLTPKQKVEVVSKGCWDYKVSLFPLDLQSLSESDWGTLIKAKPSYILRHSCPSISLIKIAIAEEPELIKHFPKIDSEIKKLAVETNADSIRYITNPSTELQTIALKNNLTNIAIIDSPNWVLYEELEKEKQKADLWGKNPTPFRL